MKVQRLVSEYFINKNLTTKPRDFEVQYWINTPDFMVDDIVWTILIRNGNKV